MSGDEFVAKQGQMIARGVGMMSYRSNLGLEEKFGVETAAAWGLWNPELFLAVTAVTLAVVVLGSLYKITTLRGGGEAVAGVGLEEISQHLLDPGSEGAHADR